MGGQGSDKPFFTSKKEGDKSENSNEKEIYTTIGQVLVDLATIKSEIQKELDTVLKEVIPKFEKIVKEKPIAEEFIKFEIYDFLALIELKLRDIRDAVRRISKSVNRNEE